jgi:hypothetical protein
MVDLASVASPGGIQAENEVAMRAPKFVHDDIVTLVHENKIGTVKEVHQTGAGYAYSIQLRTNGGEFIDAAEDELALLKIANSDETGFAIRYIT